MSSRTAPGRDDRADALHVVMVVGNDISVDTRVKKTAASLARMGFRVTVIGHGPAGREQARMADCDILRVPIAWTHDEAGPRPVPRRLSARARVRRRVRKDRDRVGAWGARSSPRPARAARSAVARTVLWGLAAAGRLVDSRLTGGARPDPEPELSLPWRSTVPIALDYLEALAPEIVRLRPDVIHAHDVETTAAASAAADRLEREGATRPVWIYDAHEYIAGLSLYGRRRTATQRAGWLNLEQEFAPGADAIITVSPDLAEELRRRYPDVGTVRVVLNAPWRSAEPEQPAGGGVRGAIGLADDVPLLVYSGVVTDARGVHTAVEAMPHLPGCHLAIVSTTFASSSTALLRERAVELDVADRVHILAPVPAQEVVAHLSTADLGLIPIRRFPSHDVALTNKLFEYLHAGLPVVVSDCPAQRRFVTEEDIGAVFGADDPVSLAAAVREALPRLAHYRERIRDSQLLDRYSWQASEQELQSTYRRLLGARAPAPRELSSDFPSLTWVPVEAEALG